GDGGGPTISQSPGGELPCLKVTAHLRYIPASLAPFAERTATFAPNSRAGVANAPDRSRIGPRRMNHSGGGLTFSGGISLSGRVEDALHRANGYPMKLADLDGWDLATSHRVVAALFG